MATAIDKDSSETMTPVRSDISKDPPGIDATSSSWSKRDGESNSKHRSISGDKNKTKSKTKAKSKSNTGSSGSKPTASSSSSSPGKSTSLSTPNRFDRVISSLVRGCETKLADATNAVIPGAQCADIEGGDFDLGKIDDLAEGLYTNVYTRCNDVKKGGGTGSSRRSGKGSPKSCKIKGSALGPIQSADTFGSTFTGLTLADDQPQSRKVEVETPPQAVLDESRNSSILMTAYDDDEECTLDTMGTGVTGTTGATGLTGATGISESNSLLAATLDVLETINADDSVGDNTESISRVSTFETSYTLNTLTTASTMETGLETINTATTNATDVQRQIGWSGSKANLAAALGTLSEEEESTTTNTRDDDNDDWDHSYSNPKNSKKKDVSRDAESVPLPPTPQRKNKSKRNFKSNASPRSVDDRAVNAMAAFGADELDSLVSDTTRSTTGTPATVHTRSLQSVDSFRGDKYALSTDDLGARQRTRSSLHTTDTGQVSQTTEQTDYTVLIRNTTGGTAAVAAAVGAGADAAMIRTVRSQSSKAGNESVTSNAESVLSNHRSRIGAVASVEVEFGNEPGRIPATAVDLDASDCEDGSVGHSVAQSESMISLDGLEAIVTDITKDTKHEVKKVVDNSDVLDVLGIKTMTTDISVADESIGPTKSAVPAPAALNNSNPTAKSSEDDPVDSDEETFSDIEDVNEADESFEVELGSEPYRFEDYNNDGADVEDATDAKEADEQSFVLAPVAGGVEEGDVYSKTKNISVDQSELTMTSAGANLPRAHSLRFSRSKNTSVKSVLSVDKSEASCSRPISLARVVTADEICHELGCIEISMTETSSFDEPIVLADLATDETTASRSDDVVGIEAVEGEGEEINFAQFQQTLDADRTYRVVALLKDVYGPTPNPSDRAARVTARFDGRIDYLVEVLQDLKNRKRTVSNDDPSVTSKKSKKSATSRQSAKSTHTATTKSSNKSGSMKEGVSAERNPPSSVSLASSKQKIVSSKGRKKSFSSFFKPSSKSKKKKKNAAKTPPSTTPPTNLSNQLKDIDLKTTGGRSSATANGCSAEKTVASAESTELLNTTSETTGLDVEADMNS